MRKLLAASLLGLCAGVSVAALHEVQGDLLLLQSSPNVNADFHAPALVPNEIDDLALYLWLADLDDGDGYRIWTAATNMAEPFTVHLFPSLVDDNAGVVRDVTGAFSPVAERYLIVWSQGAAGAFEIWGRLMNRDFSFVGPQFQISTMGLDPGDPAFDAGRPAVAAAGNGPYFVVTWEGDDDGSGHADGEFDVFARRVRADGVLSGGGRERISAFGVVGGDALAPAIAYRSATSEFLVVYEGDPDGGLHEPQIYAVVLDETGAQAKASAPEHALLSVLGPNKGGVSPIAKNPHLAYDSRNDHFLLVWDGTTLEIGEEAIYGRLLSGGSPVTAITRFSADGGGGTRICAARNPRVQYNLVADGFVVTWSGSTSPAASCPTDFEIVAREVDRDGNAAGAAMPISTTDGADPSYEAVSVALASSRSSQSLLAIWSGSASTPYSFDFFSQFLVLDRATSSDELPNRPRSLELSASPNPFNPQTRIAFALPSAGRVRIAIYDVRGALVRTLVDEPMDAGWFARNWNGRDDRGVSVASGIYFAQLRHALGHLEQKLVLLK